MVGCSLAATHKFQQRIVRFFSSLRHLWEILEDHSSDSGVEEAFVLGICFFHTKKQAQRSLILVT